MNNQIVGGITAGAGAALGIANSIASGVNAQKGRNQIKANRTFNENMFNSQYYKDALARSEVQSALNLQRQNNARQAQMDAAQSAVLGSTPEVQAALQQQRNASMANTIAQIAANTSAYKDAILGNYQNAMNNYYNAMNQSYANQSAQQASAANESFKMIGSGMKTMAGL